jgi:hypothetical protein
MLNPRIGWHTLTRLAAASDVTASSETAAGPKDAPLRPDTAEFWMPASMPATWQLNFSSANVDYVGIAGHNIGTCGATVTAYTSDGAPTGSPTEEVWEPLATAHTPTDNSPIMLLDTVRDAVKLRLVFSGSPSEAPQIAVIHVGEVLAMTEAIRGNHGPVTLRRKTTLYRALSRGGQFLGQNFQRLGFETSVAFELLEGDWYRDTFDPFVEAARQYPYFFAWRPGQRTGEVVYAWTGDDIHPQTMGYDDLMSVSWNLVGVDAV